MTVSGPGVARMRVQAGQFVWRFLDGPGWTRGHPYSVSAAPDGRSLRLTAAHLGDGSARLAALRPGTRVLVEGPYGRLHDGVRGRRKVLLLGAGIGIASLRALLEALPQQPGDVTIVQPAGSREQLLLAEETSALAAARGARQVVVERHRLVTLCERAEHSTVGLFSATAGSGGRRVYDPTGLVKGWAVEGAARHLALASGIAFCVNAGGDILAGTSRGAPGPRAVAHRRRGPAPAHPDRRDRRAGRRSRRHVGECRPRRAHPRPPHRRTGRPRRLGDGDRPEPAVGGRLGHCGLRGPGRGTASAEARRRGIPLSGAVALVPCPRPPVTPTRLVI